MFNRVTIAAIWILLLPMAWAQHAAMSDASCADLAKLSLPATTIAAAQSVPAGTFTPPASVPHNPVLDSLFKGLPAFCRVVAMVAPTADSAITVEVWMPAKGWNGKFRGQGNGGFAGSIDYRGLAAAVNEGYASAATDTGHAASFVDARWALGHPEKVTDFGYRAIHEMTLKAKAIVQAYYGDPAKRYYFASCSDGGREALMEAQRFPGDYDGIIAGAPANNWTRMLTNALYNSQALTLDPADYIPPAKLPAIEAAVLAACDSADGVADGILNDPRSCHFQPAMLLCKGPEDDKCLTARQARTLDVLYAGGHDSAGRQIFPGYPPGAEGGPTGWARWITGDAPGQSLMFAFAAGYFTDMVYGQPDWDLKTAVVDEALKAAAEKTGRALDAVDPDLKPFAARGGKLILYHGWNDPAISALNTIDYYNAVRAATGHKDADTSVRLFMVPGMQHCGSGPGATDFGQDGLPPLAGPNDAQHDIYLALEEWTEKASAPERMIAAKYAEQGAPPQVLMTRPLCAYPLEAKYKGTGDTNDAANFTCASAAK